MHVGITARRRQQRGKGAAQRGWRDVLSVEMLRAKVVTVLTGFEPVALERFASASFSPLASSCSGCSSRAPLRYPGLTQ